MSYLVLYLFFGSFFHFIYQSDLAPSMRMHLRERLRALRKELEVVDRAQSEAANRRCCRDLRESHRHLLEALDRVSLVALFEVDRELRNNAPLQEQVAARSQSFSDCGDATVRAVRARTLCIALQAVAINNGGLIVYLLPLMPFLWASAKFRAWLLRLAVQAVDLHQQLGPAYVRVKHDVLRL